MYYRKHGIPDEGELVLCTITKIQYHSVFATLDEYDNRGMIHISEISPGRIRNIHDFVKEGKVVVCVVLRIDKERGHIDLSLRRVNDSQRRNKLNQIKQEQKAEKIVEFAARQLKREVKQLYDEITEKAFEKYGTLYSCFEEVAIKDLSLEKLGINKETAKLFEELIKQRIKPPKVEIKGKLSLSTHAEDGIEVIKDILAKALSGCKNCLLIRFLGGGAYSVVVTAENYKDAEKTLEKVLSQIEENMKKNEGSFKFERIEA